MVAWQCTEVATTRVLESLTPQAPTSYILQHVIETLVRLQANKKPVPACLIHTVRSRVQDEDGAGGLHNSELQYCRFTHHPTERTTVVYTGLGHSRDTTLSDLWAILIAYCIFPARTTRTGYVDGLRSVASLHRMYQMVLIESLRDTGRLDRLKTGDGKATSPSSPRPASTSFGGAETGGSLERGRPLPSDLEES